ncbi:hypothetical protein OHA21_38055 [Actinoplanes sp. NBC_00393]|uniref:hypothetical protein n=1 Tax=Actinoplanes sp. NBC_00393 TaxID=2975953 RepID=UPI002E1E3CC4
MTVSAYQIERWRTAGDLPRPVRHGQGRGRGVYSEAPDEQTVQRAVMLARVSRRGSRRMGSHPIERLALGQPIEEAVARDSIDETLADIGRVFGLGAADEDAAWQTREVMAHQIPETPFRWQDMLDAVEDKPPPAAPLPGRTRAAYAVMLHCMVGNSDDVTPDDIPELLGLIGGLSPEAVEQLRAEQYEADLRGEQPWRAVYERISIPRLRADARTIEIELWQRALAAFWTVTTQNMMVAMVGTLALAGSPVDLGPHLRITAEAVHTLQADPMWKVVNQYQLSRQPRRRVRELTLGAIGMIIGGQVEAWESYLERVLAITHPASHDRP